MPAGQQGPGYPINVTSFDWQEFYDTLGGGVFLEAARDLARATFQKHLRRLSRSDRATYWGRTEMLYQPYFAYEEVLACFADRRRQTTSLLASRRWTPWRVA